jgi:hypothetical protein
MAPQLPDRYQTQVWLGRDADVEEWLATDRTLDRPVLLRVLNSAASRRRVEAFVASIRVAAGIQHIHLAGVYAVGESPGGGAYSALEWNGGVSVADRLRASETLPVSEFLPNAAGLAEGLAAFHAAGATHGAIDSGAILFSAAHPAKLGAFGRPRRSLSPADDTVALARALRLALTGSDHPGLNPSQVVEGLPAAVDRALSEAETGKLDASGLATALRATPYVPPPAPRGGWSWRWLIPATLLLVSAFLVAAVGLAIDVDPDSPFLFPATPPAATTTTTSATDTTTTQPPIPQTGTLEATAVVYDPFGDRTERDTDVPNVLDGNPDTSWRTERYFDPLARLNKPGVGLVFTVEGTPESIEFHISQDTRFTVGWAAAIPDDFEEWEAVASGTALTGTVSLQLPSRPGGSWLLWFTDLPEQDSGEYFTRVIEVVFIS